MVKRPTGVGWKRRRRRTWQCFQMGSQRIEIWCSHWAATKINEKQMLANIIHESLLNCQCECVLLVSYYENEIEILSMSNIFGRNNNDCNLEKKFLWDNISCYSSITCRSLSKHYSQFKIRSDTMRSYNRWMLVSPSFQLDLGYVVVLSLMVFKLNLS